MVSGILNRDEKPIPYYNLLANDGTATIKSSYLIQQSNTIDITSIGNKMAEKVKLKVHNILSKIV